ncbi:hypothetical protein ACFSCX_13735 [Bacillus salitolerans]|uniref:PH domain-containing protein n=1 Tax=Bacillus salitolerans TaxID=1437434 RepID=A0ABW4LSV5_9BACI
MFYTTRLFGLELIVLGMIIMLFIIRDYINNNWTLLLIGLLLSLICFVLGFVVLSRKFQRVILKEESFIVKTIFHMPLQWDYKEIKSILGTKRRVSPIYSIVNKDEAVIRLLFIRNREMILELISRSPKAIVDERL